MPLSLLGIVSNWLDGNVAAMFPPAVVRVHYKSGIKSSPTTWFVMSSSKNKIRFWLEFYRRDQNLIVNAVPLFWICLMKTFVFLTWFVVFFFPHLLLCFPSTFLLVAIDTELLCDTCTAFLRIITSLVWIYVSTVLTIEYSSITINDQAFTTCGIT